MSLVLVGTNYKYSDLKTRELFYFSREDINRVLFLLLKKNIVEAAVILTTCQRVEIYALTSDDAALKDFFLNFKPENTGLSEFLYVKREAEVVQHLFNVAAGLDSQITGENEILHQVKEAYLQAKDLGSTKNLLNKLFERALFTGKIVRQKTDISERDPSVALEAVVLAESLVGNLFQKNIYIIGAGIVAQKLAKLCVRKGAKITIVANRAFQKALDLAREINGAAVRFEEFYGLLNDADIIFSATASRHLILKKEVFEEKRSVDKNLIIFDLAFPRDIDPAIAGLEIVTLFNLDDLKDNSLFRSREVERARELVREKSQIFIEKEEILWKSELELGPAILH